MLTAQVIGTSIGANLNFCGRSIAFVPTAMLMLA